MTDTKIQSDYDDDVHEWFNTSSLFQFFLFLIPSPSIFFPSFSFFLSPSLSEECCILSMKLKSMNSLDRGNDGHDGSKRAGNQGSCMRLKKMEGW